MNQPGSFVRPRFLRAFPLSMALLLGACGGAAPEKAQTPSDAPKTESASSGATAGSGATGSAGVASTAPEPDGVTVIAQGDEPRAPLRYTFHVGQKEQMKMDMKMAMGMSTEGQQMAPITLPTVRMTMAIDPKALTPEGDLKCDFKLTDIAVLEDAQVPAKLAETLRTEMKKLVGLGGSSVVSTRGETKSAELVAPPNANPQMLEMIDNLKSAIKDLVPPLPVEPVGKGARWKSIANIDMRAMKVKRAVTYTMVARTGDKGTLQANVELTAPQQAIKSDRLPPNAKMTLDSLTASGSGSLDFDLQTLTPKSQMDIDTLAATTVEMDGKKSPLMLSTKMAVLVAPSQAAAKKK